MSDFFVMNVPQVRNKYGLRPKDIQRAEIIDHERIKQPPFWRNNVIKAWCLSEDTIRCNADRISGTHNEYWIGFYDNDAKSHRGKTRLQCTAYGGMCAYKFKTFFNPKEIECDADLEIQEKLLARLNWLIDEGIVKIPRK